MTRKEAIKKLERLKNEFLEEYIDYDDTASAYNLAIEALKEPEQKKGRWIVTGTFDDFLKCSCCGYKKPWNEDTFNFCPYCGVPMVEAKMEVDK